MAHHNGMMFSTWDRDNDNYGGGVCVDFVCGKGAWWHNDCCASSLNAIYSNRIVYQSGIEWYPVAMKTTTMMIQRK